MIHHLMRLTFDFDLICIYSLICHIFSEQGTCYKEPQERLLGKKSQTKRILRLQRTISASNVQHKSTDLFLFKTLKSVILNL